MTVRITETREIKAVGVTTDEAEYTRYGADAWYVTVGESDEPVYDCKEIEILYQKYKGMTDA